MDLELERQTPRSERVVGDGEMPLELDRLNLGALLLPGLWSLFKGTWSWFWLLLGWRIVSWFAAVSAYRYLEPPGALYVGSVLLLDVVAWVLWIAFALRANRLFWQKEQRRAQRRSETAVPRMAPTIEAYEKSQSKWAAYGIVLLILPMPFMLYSVLATKPELIGMSLARLAIDLVVVGGIFLVSRAPATSAPA